MYDRVKYFRRRQFLLGAEYAEYEGWKKIEIASRYLLSIHPDLSFAVAEKSERTVVVLGYIIDPFDPGASDEEIARRIVAVSGSLKDVIGELEKLSGRFVLILKNEQGTWVFPDACAMRPVQYCRDALGRIWCASQAETLAERFGFRFDEEVLSYRECSAYRSSKEEFWLINERTPYREVKYLLANHYLDLDQGRALRFWPTKDCIRELSMEKSIELSSPILQKSIKAAARRYDLKMGISAGSDSRRSLAAAKGERENIDFFTQTPNSYVADKEIPARLLHRLGIRHHAVELERMSRGFRELYEESATWARERRGDIAYTRLNYLGPNSTVLNSNLSEIHRCWYWLPKAKIGGEGLAVATRLDHRFAIEEFQRWIDGARVACECSNVSILTLFDLELRSRWVAAAFSEYDISHETFCPYNNRYLFMLEFGVSEGKRRSRQLRYIEQQIGHMWPEVLMEPINPPERMVEKVEHYMWHSIIHRTITPHFPIYDYLRYAKLKYMARD